jgi:NADH dehydrogenase
VGSNLIKELVNHGYQVRGLVHSDRNLQRLKGLPVETVPGSITNLQSLARSFEGVTQVFSCVGIIVESKSANFDSIHVLGTKNIVEMSFKNKVSHFIHISALGTRPDAKSRYHQTKYLAEQAIVNSGLTYTILRPSIIFGPEDDFVNRFARMLKFNPILPQIGDGKAKLQPLYIGDLAQCATASLNLPEAKNKILEIGGPQQMTFMEIVEVIKRSKGYGKRFHPRIPYAPVLNFVKIAERFINRLPVTSDQLVMLTENNTCDDSEVKRIFDLSFTSLDEGLKRYWSN